MEISHTIINLIIFVLAIYVGYHVVWDVTPALLAADASALYARNVLDFLKLVLPKDATTVDVPMDDDIVAACLMSKDGQVTRK